MPDPGSTVDTTLTAADLAAELEALWRNPDAGRHRYSGMAQRPIAGSDQDQQTPDGTSNPLWDIVRWLPASPPWYDGSLLEPDIFPTCLGEVKRIAELGLNRNALASRYAWSIITPGDVAWIGEQLAGRPVVEVGAGSGYWAWQLEQAGIDVAAYDPHPPAEDNRYCKNGPYAPVLPGGPEVVLAQHPDRVLLMVWPPYGGSHAEEALRLYRGDLLIYAGESHGGCTADDGFYELLHAEWTEVSTAPQHVTWSGIHCALTAYQRTTKDT